MICDTTTLMMKRRMISPKIFQRCPLVSAALRLRLRHGPVRSTTQAGVATHHIVRRMKKGTRAMNPAPTERHDDGEQEDGNETRRPTLSESPRLTGRPHGLKRPVSNIAWTEQVQHRR